MPDEKMTVAPLSANNDATQETPKKEVQKTEAKNENLTITEHKATIRFDYPVQQGDQVISEVTLHKPYAGELRGLKMTDATAADTDTIITLLPRISTPIIHKQTAMKIDPADLYNLGVAIVGFFNGKKHRMEIMAQMSE